MPRADLERAALAVLVEHPHGHDLRVVSEPGHGEAVVHVLGDRPGHVGAVAELVERPPVAVHEVVAAHEGRTAQIGGALEAPACLVCGARVNHRDHRSTTTGRAEGASQIPRVRRVHAGVADEVPLQVRPAAGLAAAPRVVPDHAGARLVVRDGVVHARAPVEIRDRCLDRLAAVELDDLGRPALLLDDHLAGDELGRGRGRCAGQAGGEDQCDESATVRHQVYVVRNTARIEKSLRASTVRVPRNACRSHRRDRLRRRPRHPVARGAWGRG